jgi:serine/threonine protein kinase
MLILKNFTYEQNEMIDQVTGYFIMPKYTENLDQYLQRQSKIDSQTVLKIIVQLIEAFDIVHASGRTFNDLKPQNIMVEHDKDGELYIVLIDFGFSDKFLTAQGDHINNSELKDSFQGNILFSSYDQMDFKFTSRKDDLYSLVLMMLYMLNDLDVPGLDKKSIVKVKSDARQMYRLLKQFKKNFTLQEMSCHIKL